MVKLFEKEKEDRLPSIGGLGNYTLYNHTLETVYTSGNPNWSSSKSLGYDSYYNKKRARRTYQQARRMGSEPNANYKIDTNFKIDLGKNKYHPRNPNKDTQFFYNFSDYNTRTNVAKYYYIQQPYLELTNNETDGNPQHNIDGNTLYFNSTELDNGISGIVSKDPLLLRQDPNSALTPTQFNRIKGAIPYNHCIKNFKNGFERDSIYYI
jgi:hypothetical protein